MKKNISYSLLIASIALIAVSCLSAASAKAEVENQANVNENQANINESQDSINKNQAAVNAMQANINKNQADVNEHQATSSELNGENHRSDVATFVQKLLNVADRQQGGIGDQVRTIANEQNASKENVANEIDAIKNRRGLKTFFIGTDYKNIGQLRSEMVKTGNQINRLNKLLSQTTNVTDKATLQAQIQALTLQQQKINDFIKANEGKFSLFGWFVKLFNK